MRTISVFTSALTGISQKMAVRAMTFNDFTAHSSNLFRQLHILDILKVHKLQTCSFMYELVNNNLPHHLTNNCSVPSHCYSTRRKEKGNLFVPAANTTMGKFANSYTGTTLWNNLPCDIRSKPSLNSFRQSLKIRTFYRDSVAELTKSTVLIHLAS